MGTSKKLKRVFDSIEKCYIPLLKYGVTKCGKCEGQEFYTTIKNFEKSCKNCKTRYKTTHNTLFHNVRFGLLKALHIYIDVVYENPQPRASVLARRYNITYKTAFNFKKKVIKDYELLKLEAYLKGNLISKTEKLLRLIESMGS